MPMVKRMNKTKSKRKVNGAGKLAIALILAALTLGGIGWFVLNPNIPQLLRNSRNKSGEVKVERLKQDGAVMAFFYPAFDEVVINERIAQKINEIQQDLTYGEDIEIKVDYTMTQLNNQWISLVFDAVNNQNDDVFYSSLLWNITTQQEVELEGLFDETLLRKVSLKIRNELKKMDSMQDYAYTLGFYQKTASDAINFNQFLLESDKITFFFDTNQFGNHPALSISFPMNEIANYITLDLGVMPSVEEPLVSLPERVIDPNRPMVALTFDDGPSKKNTPILIDALEQYGQVATFYMLGNRIPGNEAIVQEMINNGNEAASHSYNHPKLNKLNSTDLNYQLNQTSHLINELSGGLYQVKTFRPPYGASNETVKAASPYPFILWNIDTEDWKTRNADSTVSNIMNQVEDGDIILMHDIHAETIDAAIRVIPQLVEAGFQLVTVSELMEAKGVTMEPGKAYRSAN